MGDVKNTTPVDMTSWIRPCLQDHNPRVWGGLKFTSQSAVLVSYHGWVHGPATQTAGQEASNQRPKIRAPNLQGSALTQWGNPQTQTEAIRDQQLMRRAGPRRRHLKSGMDGGYGRTTSLSKAGMQTRCKVTSFPGREGADADCLQL